jgi:hypothetical protein
MANELFFNAGMILPMGASDLLADDANPIYAKGQISFVRDSYGVRIFRYFHNTTGGATAKGELQSRAANTTISNATSGSTTSVTKTGAGWTPSAFKDRILIVTDNDDSAGGAPEGENAPIADNTATVITTDSNRPFSVAIASLDDLLVYSLWDLKDGADNDLGINCLGISMQALTSGNWGVFQVYGYCPDVLHTAVAVTAGDPLVAAAAAVTTYATGSDGQELWIGWSPQGMSADNVQLKAFAHLNMFGGIAPGTAP